MGRRMVLCAFLAFAALAALGAVALDTGTPGAAGGLQTPIIGAPAPFQADPLQAAKRTSDSSTHRPSKVPDVVRQFVGQVADATAHGRSPASLSNALLRSTPDGRVELLFHAAGRVGADEEADLSALGAKVQSTYSGRPDPDLPAVGLIQAGVPPGRVSEAAALDWVVTVTPPDYAEADPHPNNAVNSEGVAFHNADDVQNRGVNGAGVTVGVISDGIANLATAQANNELPAVPVPAGGDAGTGDEGTAMLEIVHDMAPGAALMFDSGGGGLTDYVNAFNNLRTAGANVISEDLFFSNEPAFQRGLAAVTADNTAAAGVAVHSSEGNRGQTHTARVAANGTGGGPDGAAGPFAGCANTPDNVVAIAPGNDTTFDMQLGTTGGASPSGTAFTLQWSEPRSIFPSVGQGGFTDLNLYVMNSTLTTCLGQSTNVQSNGVGDTIEQVALPATSAGTNVKVVVDVQGSTAAQVPTIDLRWNVGTNTDNPTRAGSVNPDSNYTGLATATAALNANSGAIEPYSSGGPVQLGSTTTCPGGAAGPCTGVAGGGLTSTNSPNWAAADGVQISGAGGFGSACAAGTCFFGTSAAAPHAAGCDALLRDELNAPAAAPATTNARLAATAVDVAPVGVDNVTGAGRLDCLAAVNDPPTADADGPYNTDEGTAVTLDGTGSSDPDVGDSLTYAWDLDNDGFFDDSNLPKPSFIRGDNGVFTVRVRVTDTAGAFDTDSSTVTVKNVKPDLQTDSAQTKQINEGDVLTLLAHFQDPGWEDTYSSSIDWGTGDPLEPGTLTVTTQGPPKDIGRLDGSHRYGDNGVFTVVPKVTDDDGGSDSDPFDVTVDNVPPTAVIDISGAILVNGVPTFINSAGQPIDFKGKSKDPGSDDLALSWDWGDGPPSPDVVTTSLVNPPFTDPFPSPSVQPRDVNDTKTHTFGEACLYEITFRSLDDDSGSASNKASVIVAGNATKNRPSGYWQTEFKRVGRRDFTDAQLNCYLAIVGYVSKVFNEVRDASTIEKAYDVLWLAHNGGSATEHLDRSLLTALLNFANGSLAYGETVNGVKFSAALATAEAVRANPASTDAQLRRQKQIIDRYSR